MLGRGVNAILKHNPLDYPWGDTLNIFQNADLRICNLECVISDIGEPQPGKTFHFRTDPKNVEVLKIARFSPISIANNHTLDFGTQALEQMTNTLKKTSINFAGAGENIVEASMPALENGERNYVGMIAFTDNKPWDYFPSENESDWAAGDNTPGIFYVPIDLKDHRTKVLFDNIKKVRDDVKVLIVSAHWGPNWGYEVPKEHIVFAHALIEAGVDIIYGHSAHIFRGIEIYKGKPILYSTGNFVDDYAVDKIERNDESFIFEINTDEKYRLTQIKLYPTVIRNLQAKMAEGLEAQRIALKMQDLCTKLQTKSNLLPEERVLQVSF